jgi:hypothetical protein
MMDRSVQLSVICVVGVVSVGALYMNHVDVVQCGIAGLIGFLGAKSIENNSNKKDDPELA